MHRTLAIAAFAVLAAAGCALSPLELEQQGEREHYTSIKPPAAAAECMARNADGVKPTVFARVRPGTESGVVELVAQIPGAGTGALARLTPAGTGSDIDVWISPMLIFHERNIARAMAAGC